MIIVSVQLKSANGPHRDNELARMEICNDESGTAERRNYKVRTLRGRGTQSLNYRITQRDGSVKDWPSEQVHIWNLVEEALKRLGYGRRETKASAAPPFIHSVAGEGCL